MTPRQHDAARILDNYTVSIARVVSRTEQEGIIDRQEFFVRLQTWNNGGRLCKLTLNDSSGKPSEVLDNVKTVQVDKTKGDVSFAAADRKLKLRFESASEFRYFDYDDPHPQMQEYFAEGISAWMRVYRGGALAVSLLLYDD